MGTSVVLVLGCACMSIRNGFTIEIHSLRTFLAYAAHGAICALWRTWRIEDDSNARERVQRYP